VGQKVNPVGFRLGTSRDHDSVWYAKAKDYSSLVMEDINIREKIKSILPQAPISSISIKRTMEELIIDINTSRPGVVIGKKGEEIEKIKRELKKIVNQDVKLNVVEVKQPDRCSASCNISYTATRKKNYVQKSNEKSSSKHNETGSKRNKN